MLLIALLSGKFRIHPFEEFALGFVYILRNRFHSIIPTLQRQMNSTGDGASAELPLAPTRLQ